MHQEKEQQCNKFYVICIYVGASTCIRIYFAFKQPDFFPDSAFGYNTGRSTFRSADCKIRGDAVAVVAVNISRKKNRRGFKFSVFKILSSYKF